MVFGRRRPRGVDLRALGRRGIEIRGARQDWAGFAVAWAGRVDGDRLDDVVLHGARLARRRARAPRAGAPSSSARPTPFGGFVVDGTIEPNQWYTDDSSGGFITAGAVGGDADGDGHDDLLAGVRVADHNDRPDSGAAYLFFSP